MTLRRSAMKPGTSTLKRTPFQRKAPIKGAAFLRVEKKEAATSAKAGRGMKKRRPASTAAEKAHMAAVAALGCILCHHLGFGLSPAEVHHVRVNHGWGRSGHFNTIPLCPAHHRGQPFGVHDMGREEFTARYGISELDLLGVVRIRLGLDIQKPNGLAAAVTAASPDQKQSMRKDSTMNILPDWQVQEFAAEAES